MGCRCKERGDAVARAIAAMRQGQGQNVAKEIRFVAQSAVEDAASAFRSKIAATRQRLVRR